MNVLDLLRVALNTYFMTSKTRKKGIKFFTAVDPQTGYCLKTIPYLGKETCDSDNERCSTHRIVKELLKD